MASLPIYPRDVARLLGVTVKTLQRWDKTGVLPAKRTATGRRYYTQDQVDAHLNPIKQDVSLEGALPEKPHA